MKSGAPCPRIRRSLALRRSRPWHRDLPAEVRRQAVGCCRALGNWLPPAGPALLVTGRARTAVSMTATRSGSRSRGCLLLPPDPRCGSSDRQPGSSPAAFQAPHRTASGMTVRAPRAVEGCARPTERIEERGERVIAKHVLAAIGRGLPADQSGGSETSGRHMVDHGRTSHSVHGFGSPSRSAGIWAITAAAAVPARRCSSRASSMVFVSSRPASRPNRALWPRVARSSRMPASTVAGMRSRPVSSRPTAAGVR